MYFSLLIEGAPFVGHDANDHNLLLKGRPFIMRLLHQPIISLTILQFAPILLMSTVRHPHQTPRWKSRAVLTESRPFRNVEHFTWSRFHSPEIVDESRGDRHADSFATENVLSDTAALARHNAFGRGSYKSPASNGVEHASVPACNDLRFGWAIIFRSSGGCERGWYFPAGGNLQIGRYRCRVSSGRGRERRWQARLAGGERVRNQQYLSGRFCGRATGQRRR